MVNRTVAQAAVGGPAVLASTPRQGRRPFQAKRHVSEHALQVAVVAMIRKRGVKVFAIPNGGARSVVEGRRKKAEGMTAGIADLCLLFPGGFSCWLEMKAPNGKLSKDQRDFRDWCAVHEVPWAEAYNYDEAVEAVTRFIDLYHSGGPHRVGVARGAASPPGPPSNSNFVSAGTTRFARPPG